jgi:hypothetical protein
MLFVQVCNNLHISPQHAMQCLPVYKKNWVPTLRHLTARPVSDCIQLRASHACANKYRTSEYTAVTQINILQYVVKYSRIYTEDLSYRLSLVFGILCLCCFWLCTFPFTRIASSGRCCCSFFALVAYRYVMYTS